MSYDSTFGLDVLENSESERSASRPISMFQDSYRYGRSQGKTHVEAMQEATDYHRRYTAREHTSMWTETSGNYADEEVLTAADRISYNQLVERLYKAANEPQRQFLFATIRMGGLDQHLDAANAKLCQDICGSFYPEMVRDIAEWLNLPVRENGSCTAIARYRKSIQALTVSIVGPRELVMA
jgi:hypothetical protein